MHPRVIGPMPAEEFLFEFLPQPIEYTEPPPAPFELHRERPMNRTLSDEDRISIFMAYIIALNNHVQPTPSKLKALSLTYCQPRGNIPFTPYPTLALYKPPTHLEDALDPLLHAVAFGEVKPIYDDAYQLDEFEAPLPDVIQSCAIRDLIFCGDYRCFIFSLFLDEVNCSCRFSLWTPNGTIVSASFDVRYKASLLLSFFKRLSLCDRRQQGYDETIVPILDPLSAEHARYALYAFFALSDRKVIYDDDDDPHTVSYAPPLDMDKKFNPRDFVMLRVPSKSSAGFFYYRNVIALRSVNWAHVDGPEDKRVDMIVYDIQTNRVFLLKDSWRSVANLPEFDSLEMLNKAGVRNVPTFLFGGDIPDQVCDLNPFITRVWNSGFQHFLPTRLHQRFVTWEIGVQIHRYNPTKDLFVAVKDAVVGHRDAYDKTGLLHQDINSFSILHIQRRNSQGSQYSAGLLCDWGYATKDPHPPRCPFPEALHLLSIKVTSISPRPHTVSDDLESFFWVILYLLLQWSSWYRPGNGGSDICDVVQHLFYQYHNPVRKIKGGGKWGFLLDPLHRPLGMNFLFDENPYVTKWIEARIDDLVLLLKDNSKLNKIFDICGSIPRALRTDNEKLTFNNHDAFIQTLDDLLLASAKWWRDEDTQIMLPLQRGLWANWEAMNRRAPGWYLSQLTKI